MIYLELFLTFFKIGLFTFGGGYAMLPLVQAEVATLGWLDEATLVNFVAISESTPGPFPINLATFVGTQVGGILGAVCATVGVILPSFIVILIVAKVYDKFRKSRAVMGVMEGLKPATVGLIAAAVISVGQTALFPGGISLEVFTSPAIYISLAIFALMTVLAFKKAHPIIIVVISAVVGIGVGFALGL